MNLWGNNISLLQRLSKDTIITSSSKNLLKFATQKELEKTLTITHLIFNFDILEGVMSKVFNIVLIMWNNTNTEVNARKSTNSKRPYKWCKKLY